MISFEKNEFTHNIYRRHWIALASDIVVFGVLFAVVGFGTYYAMEQFSHVHMLMLLIGVVFTHLLALAFIVSFTDYWLDSWIVTNVRIIDIEQKGLFHREHSEFTLDRIQDVTVDVKGILATLLDFGDVQVQTAGMGRQFIFKQVPHPHKIKSDILEVTAMYHSSTSQKYTYEKAKDERSVYSY